MRNIGQPDVVASLHQRIGRLTADTQRRWGKMNVQQMLLHCGGAMERVNSGQNLPVKGKPSRVARFVGLQLPLPWPHGLKTGLDPAGREVDQGEFERDRKLVTEQLDTMAGLDSTTFPNRHPLFGEMSTYDWHRWAFRHLDHHLRQFGV